MSAPPRGGPSSDAATEPEEETGSVGLRLALPGGESIASVAFSLTNPANTYAGTTAHVGPSGAVDFVIGGVAAGAGYSIDLSATSTDGAVTCSGSHGTGTSDAGQDNGPPFSVASHQSTLVSVQMICVKNKN